MARPVTVPPLEYFPNWPDRKGAHVARVLEDPHVEAVRLAIVRLYAEREARGLSWRQLDELTSVNYATLRKMVTGEQWPRAEHIAACELSLGIQLWPALEVVRQSLAKYRR